MMKKIVESENGIPFIDIILNEKLVEKKICVPKEMIASVGGINHKIYYKKNYELLVRIAEKYRVKIENVDDLYDDPRYEIMEESEAGETGWMTDCYIIGKYSKFLQETGYFDIAVTNVLEESIANGRYKETLEYLEKMIRHAEEYYEIDDTVQPILIYKGDTVCYEVLNFFAEKFGAELEHMGQRVEYFDISKEAEKSVVKYKGRHFKAIIGVQTYLFSIKMKDNIHYLHEYIYGPKFNFVFDHPVWFYNQLQHHLNNFFVLTLDVNYVNFYRTYYSIKAFLFPPAGYSSYLDLQDDSVQRKYEVSFIGTFSPYMEHIKWLHGCDRTKRFLGNRFITIMRKNVRMPAEEAFKLALDQYKISLEPPEFLKLFLEFRRLIYGITNYYREKVVRVLLENGIQIDVFGDSWDRSKFGKYSTFRKHPNVTVEEGIQIWRQSKLSLNIMSWHKAGFTERMANIMLAGAVLITDWTGYLEGRYHNDELLIFDLDNIQGVIPKIKKLLHNDQERLDIATKGLQRTLKEHTWEKRAKEFLELLRQV